MCTRWSRLGPQTSGRNSKSFVLKAMLCYNSPFDEWGHISQARCLRQLGRALDMGKPAPRYETAMDDILFRSLSRRTSLPGGLAFEQGSTFRYPMTCCLWYLILLSCWYSGTLLVIWMSAGSGTRHSWAWLCLVGFYFAQITVCCLLLATFIPVGWLKFR